MHRYCMFSSANMRHGMGYDIDNLKKRDIPCGQFIQKHWMQLQLLYPEQEGQAYINVDLAITNQG